MNETLQPLAIISFALEPRTGQCDNDNDPLISRYFFALEPRTGQCDNDRDPTISRHLPFYHLLVRRVNHFWIEVLYNSVCHYVRLSYARDP